MLVGKWLLVYKVGSEKPFEDHAVEYSSRMVGRASWDGNDAPNVEDTTRGAPPCLVGSIGYQMEGHVDPMHAGP